ncbi:phosphorylase [Novosphingobium sp. LASN5T]|uniref:phosphorylase family protein n=1 Tax=Novosphingobium sp. LASN5T TaxID=2491021 RepID=UPI000F5F3C86|nr:phosphorylase [Novosphingobium sp. LASN5T]RQW45353.1 phosphorylase [Novosphingobium sp. LASN5T]
MNWIVACGLKREADLIRRSGAFHIVVGGGDSARLEAELDDMAEMFPAVILSSGIAGALDPALKIGDAVLDGDAAVVEKLRAILPEAVVGAVAGRDVMTPTVAGKRALRAETGALAVDMESHVAARVAARRGLPFAVVRVISDSADEALPPAAQIGMKPDGSVALGAVLASLARNPAQLPALIRTGRHAGLAFRTLGRVHHALGRSGIFSLDLGQFALDVA